MKSLSSRQTETVGRLARATIPLLKWTTYSDKGAGTVANTRYCSDRACIYDYGNAGTDRHFYDVLVALPDRFRASMNHLPDARGGASPGQRALSVVLSNAPLEAADTSLLATIRTDGLELSTIEVAELDRKWESETDPLDLRSLTGDEHVVWGRFDVAGLDRANEADLTLSLTVPEPEIPWVVLADSSANDPEDLGKRHNVMYGEVKRQRCLGINAPARTTLAQALTTTTTGNVTVTSTTGLGTSVIQVGGERISITVVNATTINIANLAARAQSSTVAAEHPAGSAVMEILNGAKWAFSGHVSKAIDAVYCMNPYNGELFTLTATTHYTATLNDGGLSTISMTDTQMRALYDAMARSAAVTTQPVVDHDTIDVVTEQSPTSGDANLRDWDTSTSQAIASDGTVSTSMTFTDPTGTVISQYVYVDLDVTAVSASGAITIASGASTVNLTTTGRRTVRLTATTNAVTSVSADGSGIGETRATVYEVWRDVFYNAPAPTLSTNTAISAADLGYPLDLYADGKGYEAPDSNYTVASGTLLENPSDILRHLIAVVCGKGHGAVDDTTFDAAASNLGSSYKLAVNLTDHGVSFRDVAGRIAFEGAANLVQEETSSASVWKLHTATYDSGNDVYEFSTAAAVTLTQREWTSCEERGRDADGLFTRFRVLYNRDPSLGDDEDAYRGLLRCDASQNDISTQVPTASFTAAEARYGRRDHPGFGLRCVNDATTATWWAGYMAQELMRAARQVDLDGVPWDVGYALERGDMIALQTPWDTASRYWRVLEHEYDFATATIGLVALEVQT